MTPVLIHPILLALAAVLALAITYGFGWYQGRLNGMPMWLGMPYDLGIGIAAVLLAGTVSNLRGASVGHVPTLILILFFFAVGWGSLASYLTNEGARYGVRDGASEEDVKETIARRQAKNALQRAIKNSEQDPTPWDVRDKSQKKDDD